jgi:two-component system, NarL family, sensor histidine kinase UhpB
MRFSRCCTPARTEAATLQLTTLANHAGFFFDDHFMTLRSSINWLMTLVMLGFILTLGALQIAAARRSTAAEMEAGTRVTVQLMNSLINFPQTQHDPVSLPDIASFLEKTGRIRAHDIQLVDATGQVLHQSLPSPWKQGRHAPQWFSHWVGPPAAPISIAVGTGLLRIQPDNSRMVLDAWDELLTLFWLSLLLFALLNLLVFWFAGRALQENHTWMQLIQQRIEEERRKLALELHDEIGQSLTAVKTIATTLVSRSRHKQPELEAPAQMIVDISSQMYDAMHGIVRRLRPLVLDRLGLPAALQELVASQQERDSAMLFTLTINGDLKRISPDASIAAYRIVQESLTNIARHANATNADIALDVSDKLTITIQDNGYGKRLDTADQNTRYGLIGMRERAESLQGTFHWQAGNGVRVVATLPVLANEKTSRGH